VIQAAGGFGGVRSGLDSGPSISHRGTHAGFIVTVQGKGENTVGQLVAGGSDRGPTKNPKKEIPPEVDGWVLQPVTVLAVQYSVSGEGPPH